MMRTYKPGGLQSWSIGPNFPWTVVGVTNAATRHLATMLGLDLDTVFWQPWNTLTNERGPICREGAKADAWIESRQAKADIGAPGKAVFPVVASLCDKLAKAREDIADLNDELTAARAEVLKLRRLLRLRHRAMATAAVMEEIDAVLGEGAL